MNDKQIDEMLDDLQRERRSEAPDLRREVRAEIARVRNRPTYWQRLLPVLNWSELLMQPRLAAGALAIAVTIGILPGVLTLAPAQPRNEAEYARKSLHLEVFDAAGMYPNQSGTFGPWDR